VPPAPRRAGLAWPAFRRAHADGLPACDLFAVETAWLQVVSVLFYIQVPTRRVCLTGCSARPTADGVTRQARDVTCDLDGAGIRPTVPLRDRGARFSPSLDGVFAARGTRVVRTPVRAPRANAFAARRAGAVRRDRLDRLLVLGPRHLERVLHEDAGHHDTARPRRALRSRSPLPQGQPGALEGPVRRHDRLGGVPHEYPRCAA
jgi:hypothetical protein